MSFDDKYPHDNFSSLRMDMDQFSRKVSPIVPRCNYCSEIMHKHPNDIYLCSCEKSKLDHEASADIKQKKIDLLNAENRLKALRSTLNNSTKMNELMLIDKIYELGKLAGVVSNANANDAERLFRIIKMESKLAKGNKDDDIN